MRPRHTPDYSAGFRWPARLAGLAAALLLLAACGGSGSSGFDVAALENRAIERAIETSMCQPVDGLTICAAGQTPLPAATETQRATPTPTAEPTGTVATTGTPTGTPDGPDATPSADRTATPTTTTTPERPGEDTPTPTPTPTEIPSSPNVGTNLGDSNAVPCQAGAEGCVLDFQFRPENIDPAATFWIAVRTIIPPGEWRIFPDPTRTGSTDAPAFEQPVEVDFSDPEATYQIAVLVFYLPPGDPPETVERLGETGADLAFVTQELTANR